MVRLLAEQVPHVVGLDPDEESIRLALSQGSPPGVEYLQGDLLTHDFGAAGFDFITCVAALHHMDEEAGLTRMRELLRPGGTLAVVGIARRQLPRDLPWELGGIVATRWHKLTESYWETPAPKTLDFPHTHAQLRKLSQSILPGCHYRQRAMWRYVLTWTRPNQVEPTGTDERRLGVDQ